MFGPQTLIDVIICGCILNVIAGSSSSMVMLMDSVGLIYGCLQTFLFTITMMMMITVTVIIVKITTPITTAIATISAVERAAPGSIGVVLCVGVAVTVTEGVEVAGNTPSRLSWISADYSVPSILQVYVRESDS